MQCLFSHKQRQLTIQFHPQKAHSIISIVRKIRIPEGELSHVQFQHH